MIYLETKRLILRDYHEDDFKEYYQLKSDPKTMYYLQEHEQVGSVGYTVMNDTPVGKIVGAGYFIYPKFWGKGYTTEAKREWKH